MAVDAQDIKLLKGFLKSQKKTGFIVDYRITAINSESVDVQIIRNNIPKFVKIDISVDKKD